MSDKLTKQVKKAQDTLGKDRKSAVLSKEALDALALSEEFSAIKPEVYVLPLDAMAGFCAANDKTEMVLEAVI